MSLSTCSGLSERFLVYHSPWNMHDITIVDPISFVNITSCLVIKPLIIWISFLDIDEVVLILNIADIHFLYLSLDITQ